MNTMKDYKLETVAFLSGALVMILELTGSRVLSPYFGNSIYIWTGMIGVILGFLSLGYYYGGILADKGNNTHNLANTLWLSGIGTFLLATFKEPLLQLFSRLTSGDIKTGSLISIIFLFGPISILLGCVTPIIVKLKLDNLKDIGKDVGKIYAISTIGSITGTFLSGYYLIPYLGNTNLIYTVALILILTSFWIIPKLNLNKIVILTVLSLLFYLRNFLGYFQINAIADIDTSYNRILIKEEVLNNQMARLFMTDRLGIQSAIYLNSKQELASEYTKSFALFSKVLPKSNHSLMIGGAGMAFPSHFISQGLGKKMDVVEIDPDMTKIAKKYFFFSDLNNLNIYADDARIYLQKTRKTYDLIFLDAFNSIAPPHHLTTKEFFHNLSKKMTTDSTLVANLVTSISGKNSGLLNWQYSTLKEVFPKVEVYKIIDDRPDNQVQNIILISYKNQATQIDLTKLSQNIKQVDSSKLYNSKKILTDDYAPVEHLAGGFMGGL